jgi:AcrR family transcriptional regulator
MDPMPRRATRSGDPVALLGLLWSGTDAAPGRSGVSVPRIREAALALADRDGLEAVTLRRVAEGLGVGTMTLYSYVPGRPELVELMVDHMAATTYEGHPLPPEYGDAGATWRDRLRHVAWRNYDHTLEHPWLVDVPPGRPVLGPGVSRKYDLELTPLDGVGLSDLEMDLLLTTVQGMVAAAARFEIGLRRNRAESQMSDNEWWAVAGPAMAKAMGEVSLPVGSRVGTSVGSAGEPRKSLEFGLDALLRGIDLP